MDDSVSKRLRNAVRRYLAPRRHSALLAAIIATFAVRPLIGDIGDAPIIFSIVILALMLIALYNINVDELMGERGQLQVQAKRRRALGWVLASTAIAERLVAVWASGHRLYLLTSVSWLLFFSFVTWTELRSLLKHREITRETISLSVSIYLLLGLTWGILYIFIFELQPHAFSAVHFLPGLRERQPAFPELIYFSLTTLSTVGYGDITPLTLQARYAAVAEGIGGQLYLAILVARLVALNMGQSGSKPADSGVEDTDPGAPVE
jgi:voltage-gated potassium channel Kch